MADLLKGEDKNIVFTLTDGNAVPINLTTETEGILVYFYYKNSEVLEKYSRDAKAGFNNTDFEVTDAANGEFTIHLQSSKTVSANDGEILAEVKVKQTDADFADNLFRSIIKDAELFTIKDALSKSDT